LYDKYKILTHEHKLCKNSLLDLQSIHDTLHQENLLLKVKVEDFLKEDFPSKMKSLSEENEKLKKALGTFEPGKNTLNMLLNNQRPPSQNGLGYDPLKDKGKKPMISKPMHRPRTWNASTSHTNHKIMTCRYCDRKGHIAPFCYAKNNDRF